MKTLGELITDMRKARHMSQTDLAARLKVSRVAVTKWENGGTQNLKLANLVALCRLFGVSADNLLRAELTSANADVSASSAPAFEQRHIAAESIARYSEKRSGWSFTRISRERFMQLPEIERAVIEGQLLQAVNDAEARLSKQPAQNGLSM